MLTILTRYASISIQILLPILLNVYLWLKAPYLPSSLVLHKFSRFLVFVLYYLLGQIKICSHEHHSKLNSLLTIGQK